MHVEEVGEVVRVHSAAAANCTVGRTSGGSSAVMAAVHPAPHPPARYLHHFHFHFHCRQCNENWRTGVMLHFPLPEKLVIGWQIWQYLTNVTLPST